MEVVFDNSGEATLRDAENFRSFRALVPVGTDLDGLPRANSALVRATRDGDHLWLAVDQVALLGPSEAEWRTNFEKMIAYASTKGWTRGEPLEVATHVEAE